MRATWNVNGVVPEVVTARLRSESGECVVLVESLAERKQHEKTAVLL